MNRHLLILVSAFFLFSRANAEEPLSLRQALERARGSGYDLAVARAERNAAQADANRTLSVFLPQIRLSSAYTATNDPLNVFGMKLKERVVTAADFNPAVLNEPDRFTQYSTRLEIQQPLINLDGFWGRAAAVSAADAMAYKEARTEHYLAFRVKMAYFQLVLARASRGVAASALAAAEANAKQSRDYLDQGLINKSDELFAEVRLLDARSRDMEAANAVRSAEGALRMLLGAPAGMEIVPTDSLAAPGDPPAPVSADDVNANRSDMLAMRRGVDAAEGILRMRELKLLPSLNAFGSYDLNDQKLLGRAGKGWTIGAIVQWDIFPGFGNVAEIQKAGAEAERARTEFDRQRAQNANDLADAYRALELSRGRLALAEEGARQSAENYRILSERYATGIGKTTDLLNAEAGLANARMERLQTLFACNAALFTIELLTEREAPIHRP
jgi:outer membrane protein TolC